MYKTHDTYKTANIILLVSCALDILKTYYIQDRLH